MILPCVAEKLTDWFRSSWFSFINDSLWSRHVSASAESSFSCSSYQAIFSRATARVIAAVALPPQRFWAEACQLPDAHTGRPQCEHSIRRRAERQQIFQGPEVRILDRERAVEGTNKT